MAKVFSIGGNTISYGGFMLREQGVGSLTITKTVSGVGFDPAKTFEIVVTFGKAITYKVNGTAISTPSNVYVANLASGQSVTLSDIPEGTTYNVAETPLSQADELLGYSNGSISGASGTMDESSVTSSATNIYRAPGTLTISKSGTGTGFDTTKTFEIIVRFSEPIYFTVNGVLVPYPTNAYIANLASGGSVVLGSIKYGTGYTVEESPLSQADLSDGYRRDGVTNGSGTIQGLSYTATANNKKVGSGGTIRFRFDENPNYDPTVSGKWKSGAVWTHISSNPNIWEYSNSDPNWNTAFTGKITGSTMTTSRWNKDAGDHSEQPRFTVIYADLAGVTSMTDMFVGSSVVSFVPFSTEQSESCSGMFSRCTDLVSIPDDFDVNYTNAWTMFEGCTGLTNSVISAYYENMLKFKDEKYGSGGDMFMDIRAINNVPDHFTYSLGGTGYMARQKIINSVELHAGDFIEIKSGDIVAVSFGQQIGTNNCSVTFELVNGSNMHATSDSSTTFTIGGSSVGSGGSKTALWRYGKSGTYRVSSITNTTNNGTTTMSQFRYNTDLGV